MDLLQRVLTCLNLDTFKLKPTCLFMVDTLLIGTFLFALLDSTLS